MSFNNLLNQFLGGQNITQETTVPNGTSSTLASMVPTGVSGGLVGGLAAGGLLGVVAGNKKMRKAATKMAGGALGVGGAAALGLVAYKAYQNWQSGAQTAGQPIAANPVVGRTEGPAPKPLRSWQGSQPPVPAVSAIDFNPEQQLAADGTPFQAALVKAMIAAANADGHIDEKEQWAIFDAMIKMDLGHDEKSLVLTTMQNPPDIKTIAGYASGLEQASEIYLVSRLAIDPDDPREQVYLHALARELNLPDDLTSQIEKELEGQAQLAA